MLLLSGSNQLFIRTFLQVFLTRRLQVGKEMQCHPECFRIYALNYKEYIYTSGNLSHVYPYMMSPEFPDTRTIGKYSCVVRYSLEIVLCVSIYLLSGHSIVAKIFNVNRGSAYSYTHIR